MEHVSKSFIRAISKRLTFCPMFLAIFPRHMVVLVRIPGCSSFAVRARHRSSSPLIVLSDSLLITAKTALTVCSRTTGAASVNPVVYLGKSKIHQVRQNHTPFAERFCRSQLFVTIGQPSRVDCPASRPSGPCPDYQTIG